MQNPFSIQPDASKWWQGQSDLSGQIWLRSDAQNLLFAVQIRDDVFRPAAGTGEFKVGDGVRLSLVAGEKILDLSLAGNGTFWRRVGNEWQKIEGLQVVRDEKLGSTWYFAKIARDLVPSRFALNAVAIDDDWGARKQWAPISDGFGDELNLALVGRQSADWPRFVLGALSP